MKTELVMETSALNFTNEELRAYTKRIINLLHTVTDNAYDLCWTLYKVQESRCYIDDGYNTVVAYAAETFGYKKSVVYDMVNVAERFLTEIADSDGNLQVECIWGRYGVTQLVKMLALTNEQIEEAAARGDISEESTCAEIRAYVKTLKQPLLNDTESDIDDSETDADDTDDEPDLVYEDTDSIKDTEKHEELLVVQVDDMYFITFGGDTYKISQKMLNRFKVKPTETVA